MAVSIEKGRIGHLDFARGVTMVFMALDHTSYFWNKYRVADEGLRGNFPHYADLPQLLTRVATHFAPTTFIWLAGLMVALSATKRLRRGDSQSAVSWHFTIRGLILILLHLTIVNLGFELEGLLKLNWKEIFLLQVLWTIGMNMIILAWVRRLGVFVLAVLALLNFFAFPLFYQPLLQFTHPNPFLYALGIATFAPSKVSDAPIVCLYPLIPWMGVMILGYLWGLGYVKWVKDRQAIAPRLMGKIYLALGIGFSLMFLMSRYGNGYGNQIHWQQLTFSQFVTLSKYPPDLAYLFLTLGIMFILLAVSLKIKKRMREKTFLVDLLVTFGRVPLFFYCLHPLLYGSLAIFLGIQRQFGLPVVYLVWIIGLGILYKPCQWFFEYKSTHSQSLVRYI
jgi:uncharacterized membrane protein